MNSIEKKYYKYVKDNKLYTGLDLKYYLQSILYRDVELKEKVVLDIGAGNGVYSFFALAKGAKKLVCIEPELEGSRSDYINNIRKFSKYLDMENKVEVVTDLFQNYKTEIFFDVILMHYSINHIDEPNCITLRKSSESQAVYAKYFDKIHSMLINGGDLLVTDVSRYNFFDLVKIKNPFVPTIEWEKHQSPYVWKRHLEKGGFRCKRLEWTPPNRLKAIRHFISNFLFLYFTSSLFLLHMKK